MIFEVFPKLNIFLKIVGFRGSYHKIFSRFVLAQGEVKDYIAIKSGSGFSLKGDFGCEQAQNLIYRAILALKGFLDARGKDTHLLDTLHIEVQKGIPKGAGLGGGSADAGVCLQKINEMFALGLSADALRLIGSKVGADVAFFTSGFESANVFGIGEILEKFDEKSAAFEIFVPDIFCDTRVVYAQYDMMFGKKPLPSADFLQQKNKPSIEFLSAYQREELNDLFCAALMAYPALKEIHQDLGSEWFFSGSGSSFFRLKEQGC
ncbi:4-(cytidine 5'-diphospho)-2-C-methyl-D-erythritol kinase [Helicobacter sp. 12S02634-8]|uniref:4-(cytidine 5'-diphospho)-2-C-methyl-D-erythritol kinase n=1 Tax=Helicobacter sp. 12S02634-8 TaxID=1476199 RepID=UPI000BA51BCB|nr:4-(cytidine 5'-diphospho)-2-C-methyl-D-erythritol kinase [Helicobacter sp. 12S02634-8]PAF48023.1 4-(cytidine 5'-diphospho)-2-C-methyl-D-erythritol kinase [Helicobacter sp. 12S02634-8]